MVTSQAPSTEAFDAYFWSGRARDRARHPRPVTAALPASRSNAVGDWMKVTDAGDWVKAIDSEDDVLIGAMPGCFRLGWRHGLLDEVYKAKDVGVNSIVLFPKIPDALKSSSGDEAYNDNGLVPRAIRLLKDKYPDIVIYTDVALDPYFLRWA